MKRPEITKLCVIEHFMYFHNSYHHGNAKVFCMQSYSRVGLLTSEGGCPVGGVGVRVCGEEEVEDSRTERSALPGTGLHTPSSSLPGEQK